MPTQRILVTGGSGKVGYWLVKHLVESGYDVVNVDVRPRAIPQCRTIVADLTQLGQVVNAFSIYNGFEHQPFAGVIHMAAIPRPFEAPNDEVFRVNVLSTYNVLEACAILGIKKAAIASSESSYGLCFSAEFFPPKYLPVDEAHPQLPEDSYGLSKIVNEATADTFHRRTGMQILSLRIGNVLSPEDHARVRATYPTPEVRLRNLWSYIDARDLAVVCRLCIEKDGLGCQPIIVSADDTSSDRSTRELIKQYLPTVADLRRPLENRAPLLANDRCRQLLGWKQQYFL